MRNCNEKKDIFTFRNHHQAANCDENVKLYWGMKQRTSPSELVKVQHLEIAPLRFLDALIDELLRHLLRGRRSNNGNVAVSRTRQKLIAMRHLRSESKRAEKEAKPPRREHLWSICVVSLLPDHRPRLERQTAA